MGLHNRRHRSVVAVTDRDWFDHLRRQPDLAEVNFWSPSPRSFQALSPGELFLFKLHAPTNMIVGGGIFAFAKVMPLALAWEAFSEAEPQASSRCESASCATANLTGLTLRSRSDAAA